MLMGDNWVKTIIRVVTPNAVSSLLEVFSYYFVNAMVTVRRGRTRRQKRPGRRESEGN